MIYLASPYSHHSIAERHNRYRTALSAVAWIYSNDELQDRVAFSPIVYTHHLHLYHFPEASGFETWQEMDLTIINKCDSFWILTLDGWHHSEGIRRELNHWIKSRQHLVEEPAIHFMLPFRSGFRLQSYGDIEYSNLMEMIPEEYYYADGSYSLFKNPLKS